VHNYLHNFALLAHPTVFVYNPDDPATCPPIDVCLWCFEDEDLKGLDAVCDHPAYEEQCPPYKCAICEVILMEEDN
jgi:hypothetical protein